MKKVIYVLMIIGAILIIVSVGSLIKIRSLSNEMRSLQGLITEKNTPEDESQYLVSIEETNKSLLSVLSSIEDLYSKMELISETMNSISYSQPQVSLLDNEGISNSLNEITEKQKQIESQISSVGEYKNKIDTILTILVDDKTTSEFVYVAPSNEQEFTYTHIRFLNALNRDPEDIDLWEEYVSFILTYGNYSDFQIADENINSALLFVSEEDINHLLVLDDKVKDAIASLETNEPIVYNEFNDKCSKLEDLFLSEEYISYSEITNEYNALLNQYSSMDDINDNTYSSFAKLTEYYNVIDSFENIKATAIYWVTSENDTYDTCQILATLQSSLLDTKTDYSQIGISSASILKSKYDAEDAIESLISYARNLVFEEAKNSKPSVKFMTKEEAKVEYTKYEMTLERLASYLPNDSILQEQINQMIIDCYASITDISERQSKSYQIWVYNTIIDAKNKVSKKKDADSFNAFFSINSALITVPEINSLYLDTLTSVKDYVGDKKYEEYVKSVATQGLKSYEDF